MSINTASTRTREVEVDRDSVESEVMAETSFSSSVIVSAIRCTFSYVLLPLATPFLGFSSQIGPGIGAVIGVVALGANFYSIARFWKAKHKWRKPVTVLHVGVIILLLILLWSDVNALLS